MSIRKVLTLVVSLAATSSLGFRQATAAQESAGVLVVVDNHSSLDMHVYAVQSGVRRSLGLTTAFSTRRFELPRVFSESGRDVQLLADPIGSRAAFVSAPFFMDSGDQLNLMLENALRLSTTTLSPRPTHEKEPKEWDDEGSVGFRVSG
jgi:hypothetical protein